ncbi:hypothetical protein D9619_007623 [Psilocybe cf. subviscida]|uniref:Uncharacterized protein n=1 Tax=Psilocybe cf. subviscida TaxID=2480587 RepID=A0A8H5AU35_9AGAR|nr:hypothetical protein D9619_007623 [Psilocybe cf. subviscida]
MAESRITTTELMPLTLHLVDDLYRRWVTRGEQGVKYAHDGVETRASPFAGALCISTLGLENGVDISPSYRTSTPVRRADYANPVVHRALAAPATTTG